MGTENWGLAEEAAWLLNNPHFEERPASMPEFLGPDYINIEKYIRPGIRKALVGIFGDEPNPKKPSKFEKAMLTGGIGVGKQIELSTKVLTPTGWKRAGDIKVGDYLIGSNGKPTKVLRLFHPGLKPFYRMWFKDGAYAESCEDHMWAIDEPRIRAIPGTRKTERYLHRHVWSTKEIAQQELKQGSPGKQSYRFRIPQVEAVHFESQETLSLPAYTMGALLANGSFRKGTPTLSSDDLWIGERVACDLQDLMPEIRVERQTDGRQWCLTTGQDKGRIKRTDSNPVMRVIRALGLGNVGSREKFIPRIYMTASVDDRMELLHGLMDNDGSSYGNNHSSYSTSSERLATDVQELVRSLGGYATVTSFERRDVTEHQVHVNMGSVCPFSLPRKVERWKPRTNQPPARSIVKIEPIGDREGVCFQVDAEDSLFVMDQYVLTHNSTFASIALPYLVHWTLCLKDPQDYFNLMPGSRISFMMMSTSSDNARGVIFDDVKARIENSKWFKDRYPYDDKWEKQIRFPQKDVFIIPGGSKETQFEGYNILGGILDEMDSHKQTQAGIDYAEQGYTTILNRIQSRYGDKGLIIPIGQMKKASGFAATKYKEFLEDETAYVERMTIWESFGMEHYRDEDGNLETFYYDRLRNDIVPDDALKYISDEGSSNLMRIPKVYLSAFQANPVKALRDLAGYPPLSESPFISLHNRIVEARELWIKEEGGNPEVEGTLHDLADTPGGWTYPVDTDPLHPQLSSQVIATDSIPRVVHVDQAYSGQRGTDAAAISMGHIARLVDDDEGEEKPFIVIDFMMRIKAPPGGEIMLADLRKVLYELRDERGYNIRLVTFDTFQSQASIQALRKKRFKVEALSVDREKLPYEDLRDTIYEGRLAMPPYLTYMNPGDVNLVDIAFKELSELTDTGRKIDHPTKGSKDIADTLAAVVYTLIGDKKYRRGVKSRRRNLDSFAGARGDSDPNYASGGYDGITPGGGLRSTTVPTGMLPPPSTLQIPPHLRRQ